MSAARTQRPDITVSTVDLDRLEGLLGDLRAGAPEIAEGLRSELDRARIVEPQDMPPDVVTMNSIVRFADSAFVPKNGGSHGLVEKAREPIDFAAAEQSDGTAGNIAERATGEPIR